MENIKENLLELIGNTPLMHLSKIHQDSFGTEILAKIEYFNPNGSVKDRTALAMIEDAEQKGLLKKGTTIIEPTSGNTGIGLAWISAIKGYKLILTMPETMSIERRRLLAAFGCELVLTEGAEGMKGAIRKAEELCKSIEGAFIPGQFTNPANPAVHYNTTAEEILRDTDGHLDVFIAGVGTGGTLTGVSRKLKSRHPEIETVAVEPASSPVLSEGKAGKHKIQGIGAGFVPEIYDATAIDQVMTVTNEDAMSAMKTLARKEGLLVGISAGAAVSAAVRLAKHEKYRGKRIVVLLPDTGERYLSEDIF